MVLALTGGFLGSGKTTAIVHACKVLVSKGTRVTIIANDQGSQQVDSAFVRAMGVRVEEVGNGCFCCRYGELEGHLQRLHESEQPDIVFAEAVGSCTDLVATIVKPLSKSRPAMKIVVSVFADAGFLASLMEGRTLFEDESIRYIYKKQLEEADLLVINKADTITPLQLADVDRVISMEYSAKAILHQNSLEDVSSWLTAIDQFRERMPRHSLDIDYDVYGEGESKLAWLDRRIVIQTPLGDGAFIASNMIRLMFDQLQAHNYQIGHLKFFLEGENWNEKISFTAIHTSGEVKIRRLDVFHLRILINARVQIEPELLKKLADEVIGKIRATGSCTITTESESAFRPNYPRPMHRVV